MSVAQAAMLGFTSLEITLMAVALLLFLGGCSVAIAMRRSSRRLEDRRRRARRLEQRHPPRGRHSGVGPGDQRA